MPKIDRSKAQKNIGSSYPSPFDAPCKARQTKSLSDAGGLTQFGVHEIRLTSGTWASQRHWHSAEDEFAYILSGQCTLIDDAGETALRAGDVCTHKAGDKNAHHLVNKSESDVVFLVVGSRNPREDHCQYPDIDLDLPAGGQARRTFKRKDGRPY